MDTNSNIPNNKFIGVIMLAGAFIAIISMVLHPEGITQNSSDIMTMKWVHGILIFLLVFNAFGVNRITDSLVDKRRDMKFGMLFYHMGLIAFIGGALISGFVQTSLPEADSINSDVFSTLNTYSSIFNQALAKLGVISFGAAAVFFTSAFVMEKGLTRLVGVVGGIIGIALIASILAGVYLTVINMTILTVLIVVWHSVVAFWLLKN